MCVLRSFAFRTGPKKANRSCRRDEKRFHARRAFDPVVVTSELAPNLNSEAGSQTRHPPHAQWKFRLSRFRFRVDLRDRSNDTLPHLGSHCNHNLTRRSLCATSHLS